MMSLLLLPNQLFNNISYIKQNNIKEVILYEEPKFFIGYHYHKLKLLYHRITFKLYQKWLESKNIKCQYIDFNKSSPKHISHIIDPLDHELEKKYKKQYNPVILDSQYFTLTREEINQNINIFRAKSGRFNHENFYKWQRKRLNILIKKNNEPEGDKWSFDQENRNAIPKNEKIPELPKLKYDKKELDDAKKYILTHFHKNYGELNLIYPINHSQSINWLKQFVQKRLIKFGKYQDASMKEEAFLYHSVLTPMLNIGLLTDWDVIKEVLKYKKNIPLSSLEGFIRQIIGWRNYVYSIYLLYPEISKKNFFKNTRKLNEKWWLGTTGIDPIDDIIKNKIVKYAYTHHIERLMYLGAFMLILCVHPDEVFRIFMEWTIDAYEWVMIPNIYGMSQFADGGYVMHRPYLSSSNYVLKMSNYKKSDWCDKWTSLYYNFLLKNNKFFSKSYSYAGQFIYIKKQNKQWNLDIKKKAQLLIKYLTN
jgi:deoxyribodipyrimidine photolyase-related protein